MIHRSHRALCIPTVSAAPRIASGSGIHLFVVLSVLFPVRNVLYPNQCYQHVRSSPGPVAFKNVLKNLKLGEGHHHGIASLITFTLPRRTYSGEEPKKVLYWRPAHSFDDSTVLRNFFRRCRITSLERRLYGVVRLTTFTLPSIHHSQGTAITAGTDSPNLGTQNTAGMSI